MSYYHNISIEELKKAITNLDADIEYGLQMMENCGYTLGYDSALQTQLMCKKFLAARMKNAEQLQIIHKKYFYEKHYCQTADS